MRYFASLSFLVYFACTGFALEPREGSAFVRVVDVGAGLCCVAVVPGPDRKHYMIYDAGNFADGGQTAVDGIVELIPLGSTIDLLVISHSDADHLKAVPFICENYHVHRFLHPRYDRTRDESFGDSNTAAWNDADAAIRKEVRDNFATSLPTVDYALDTFTFPTGAEIPLGNGKAVAIFGMHVPPPEWGFEGPSQKSKRRNAGSIVVRLVFADRSILFTGDAVGRVDGSPPESIFAAEQAMLDGEVELASDVLIAAHHGADNASSLPFIEEVSPEFVIFSAGSKHEHPRTSTAERFLQRGVAQQKLLRTDLGDSEGGHEWDFGSTGESDRPGDDDIDVLIRPNGDFFVAYRADTTPVPTPDPVPHALGPLADARGAAGRLGPAFAPPPPDSVSESVGGLLKHMDRPDQTQGSPSQITIYIENLKIENLTVQQ